MPHDLMQSSLKTSILICVVPVASRSTSFQFISHKASWPVTKLPHSTLIKQYNSSHYEWLHFYTISKKARTLFHIPSPASPQYLYQCHSSRDHHFFGQWCTPSTPVTIRPIGCYFRLANTIEYPQCCRYMDSPQFHLGS